MATGDSVPSTKKLTPTKKSATTKTATKKAVAKSGFAIASPAKASVAKQKVFAGKKGAPSSAFMKPLTPSAALAAVIGGKALPRTEITKKVWEYIKKNGLQDKTARTMINADAKLRGVIGKSQVSMFELTKLISANLGGQKDDDTNDPGPYIKR